jgi:hypothetical protein
MPIMQHNPKFREYRIHRHIAYQGLMDILDPQMKPLCETLWTKEECFPTHSCEGHDEKHKRWGNIQIAFEHRKDQEVFLKLVEYYSYKLTGLKKMIKWETRKSNLDTIIQWWWSDNTVVIPWLNELIEDNLN